MADWSIEHSPSSLFHPAARYRFSLFLSLSLSHIYVVCSLLFPVSRAPCKPRESFNSTTTTLSIPSHYDLGLDRKFNSTCISQFLFVDRLRRFAVLRPPAAEC